VKVAYLTPYPPKVDGIGAHAAEIVSRIPAGWTASVITAAGTAPDDGVGIHRVLALNRAGFREASRVLDAERPDVLHVHFAIPAFGPLLPLALAAVRAARARRIPVVITMHEVRRELDLLGPLASTLFARLDRLSDRLIVYTAEGKDLLVRRCGIDPGRISVLDHGIVVAQGAVATDRPQGREAPATLLAFGFIHPDKGTEVLLRAARLLLDRGERVRVLIAGDVRPRQGVFQWFELQDRRYRRRLTDLVADLDLGTAVEFGGFVAEPALAGVLAAATIAVAPYHRASQSGAAYLALGAGVPLVASRIPGLVATLGEAAAFFAPGDPSDLARVVSSLLADAAGRAELVEAGRALITGASMDQAVTRLISEYEEVVAQARAAS
jgi:glycosyltransferase involved in cell wall biosynthesis